MVMVSETAPTRWRATALGGLVGGYPFGYMMCTLAALAVVPLWGWRALYFLGLVPALMVFWVGLSVKESPRFQHVTAAMVKEGLKKQLDIFAPVREYPREMLVASLVYFFYLFTWIGWSAWMPQFLANEKHLGFQATATFLSIWMFVAIIAYWFCGCAVRPLRPALCHSGFRDPGGRLLMVIGYLEQPGKLVLGRVGHEFSDHGKLRHRSRVHHRDFPDPDPRHSGRRVLRFRHRGGLDGARDSGLDRHVALARRRLAAAGFVIFLSWSAVSVVRARHDAQRVGGFRRPENLVAHNKHLFALRSFPAWADAKLGPLP